MNDQNNYQSAKRSFFTHLTVYIAVMTMLVVLNLTQSPENFWVIWPMMGWGLGVLLHGFNVFAFRTE